MVALRACIRESFRRPISIASIAALAAVLLMPPQSALAATLLLDPASGAPGTTVNATANGFLSGPVTFWWDNEILLGTAASGRVRRLTFTVPPDADPGRHFVRACQGSACPPGTVFDNAPFIVTPPPTPRPTQTPAPSSPGPIESPVLTAPVESTPPIGAGGASPGAPVASDTSSGRPGATPASETPASAAPGGVIIPSTNPAGDPNAPGTVKVQFYWDREGIAIGLVLGLIALVILWRNNARLLKSRTGHTFIGTGGEKWFKDRSHHSFLGPERPKAELTDVPGDPDPKAARLMQGLSAGTHHPPKPSAGDAPRKTANVIMYDYGGTPEVSEPLEITIMEPAEGPPGPADKDVHLKGSKIGEN